MGFDPRPREGATCRRSNRARARRFDPRPGEGATAKALNITRIDKFRSTPPRRGDVRRCRGDIDNRVVSIHAPAKGRHTDITAGDTVKLFRSTPPRRGDAIITAYQWHKRV